MPPILFTDPFSAGATVNLSAYDPDYEYQGAAGRYRANNGYADAGITGADFDSIARHAYSVPHGISFGIGGDVYREGVDAVGGGLAFAAYCPSVAIGAWDFKDNLQLLVQRADAGSVNVFAIWVKAAGGLPPTQTLASATVPMAGDTAGRFFCEVDQDLMQVRLYQYDVGAWTNKTLLGSGVLPPELVAHAAADRQVGWWTIRAASGLVNFRLYDFTVYLVESVPTGTPCTFLLTVYDDNRLSPLWEASTDPAHANPILCEPEQLTEQNLDMAKGAASVGSVRVTLVDRPTIAGDQESGYLTAALTALGNPNLGGRRMRLIRFDEDGDAVVVMDGPAGQPNLEPDYASFTAEIRDTREIERKIRLFDQLGVVADELVGVAPTPPITGGTSPAFTWGTEYH